MTGVKKTLKKLVFCLEFDGAPENHLNELQEKLHFN